MRHKGQGKITSMRHERSRLRFYWFVVFISSIAAACSTVAPPGDAELSEIETGKRTLLLLRVAASIEGKIIEPFSKSGLDSNVGIAVGTFETGGEVQHLEAMRFFSDHSHAQGWTYFSVPSGPLYLAFLPQRRTNAFTYQRMFKKTQQWRVDVPHGSKLVYAGTLVVDGESGFLLFGGGYLANFRHMEIRDEREGAKALAERHLRGLGPIETVLMRRHQGPKTLTTPSNLQEKPKSLAR